MEYIRRDAVDKRSPLSHDGKDVAITLAVSLFLATLAMGFRLWMSRTRKQTWRMPEYMALASLLMFYSYAAANYLILTVGHAGYPMSHTPHWRLTFTLKCIYYLRMAYATGLGLVKCSILVIFLAVCGASSKATRLAIWITMALCISWSLVATLMGLLSCLPLRYNWDLHRLDGHCVNQNVAFSAISAIDAATTVAIILIPLSRTVGKKMTRSQTLMLVCSLIMGVFIVAITVFRTVVIAKVDFDHINETSKMLPIWTTVEWTIAIMAANTPGLWPLIDCLTFNDPFVSVENGLYERPSYNLSSHLLGRLRTPTFVECARALTTKTAAVETGSIHSSRSIMRGTATNWTEATGQAQRPGSFLALEPGEVRVQTEWSVERSSFVRGGGSGRR